MSNSSASLSLGRLRKDVHLRWYSISLVIWFFLAWVLIYAREVHFTSEVGDAGNFYVGVLLCVPVVQAIIASIVLDWDSRLRESNVNVVTGSIFLTTLLWGGFALRAHCSSWVMDLVSCLCLFFALGLAVYVFRATRMLMEGSVAHHELFEQIRSHRLLATCFFLTIFMHIAYFMAFALAFYDKSVGGLAMYSNSSIYQAKDRLDASGVDKKVESWVDESGQEPSDARGTAGLSGNDMIAQDENDMITQGSRREIKFRETDQAEVVKNDGILKMLTDGGKREFAMEGMAGDELIVKDNTLALWDIVDACRKLENEGPIQIILEGHATATDLDEKSAAYKSNFELSHARILHTQTAIVKALGESFHERGTSKWYNLEWVVLPYSNEISKRKGDRRRQTSVEVSIASLEGHWFQRQTEQLLAIDQDIVFLQDDHQELIREHSLGRREHDLDLLDYMYFTIYTITTSGYGDIVPVVPRARFISSLVNIVEVFFVVVFFNVFFSVSGGDAMVLRRLGSIERRVDDLHSRWWQRER